MKFAELEELYFRPEKEYKINKMIEIRGEKVKILGFTQSCGKASLWIMYHQKQIDIPSFINSCCSKREKLKSVSRTSRDNVDISIEKIKIGDRYYEINSSIGGFFIEGNMDICCKIWYFMNRGVSFDEFAEGEMEDYQLKEFSMDRMPDFSEPLESITFCVSEHPYMVLIEEPILFKIGENMEKHQAYAYSDKQAKETFVYYINKVGHYDVWKDARKKFSDEEIRSRFSEQQRLELMDQYFFYLEKTCPKGMDLLIVDYEAEGDVQLDFYTKEYLDSKAEPEITGGTAVFSNMHMKSDIEVGPHGLKSRVCILKAVDKDFKGTVEAELFNKWSKVSYVEVKCFL